MYMKSKKKTKKQPSKSKIVNKFEIRLIFDNKKAAGEFTSWWLDGGGDGGGNLDWHTSWKESDNWTKRIPSFIRIKGTGKLREEYEEIEVEVDEN